MFGSPYQCQPLMELSIRGFALPTPGAVHKTHVSQLDYFISVGTKGSKDTLGLFLVSSLLQFLGSGEPLSFFALYKVAMWTLSF